MAASKKRSRKKRLVSPGTKVMRPKAKPKAKAKAKPKAKPTKLARHAKRVKMTATALIRSLPVAMPAKEVVRRAKVRGLTLRPELVYNVRSKMREEQKQKTPPSPIPLLSEPSEPAESIIPTRPRKPELDLVARTILMDAHKRIVKECADEFLASYLAKLAAVVKALPSMPHSVGEILVLIMAGIVEEG